MVIAWVIDICSAWKPENVFWLFPNMSFHSRYPSIIRFLMSGFGKLCELMSSHTLRFTIKLSLLLRYAIWHDAGEYNWTSNSNICNLCVLVSWFETYHWSFWHISAYLHAHAHGKDPGPIHHCDCFASYIANILRWRLGILLRRNITLFVLHPFRPLWSLPLLYRQIYRWL